MNGAILTAFLFLARVPGFGGATGGHGVNMLTAEKLPGLIGALMAWVKRLPKP